MSSGRTLLQLLGLALSLSAIPSQAQPSVSINPKLLSSWRWRNIGPIRGGRSIAVAGSSARPLEYYMGTVGGGLWKTTDGGTTWAAVGDGQFHSSAVGSVSVCAANPDVVYVGMGEGDWRAQLGTGDGAYVTRDGGKTWRNLGLGSSSGQQTIPRMKVDPQDCNLVFAGVFGDPHGPNPERGVFRSKDGGETWQKVLYRGDDIGVVDMVLDPSDSKTIYAALWNAVRLPWGGQTGEKSGIFKSTDGGDTWSELTRHPGIPNGRIGKVALAVSADPKRVYALLEMDLDVGGLYRSDDAGATWRRVNGEHALTSRGEYFTRMFADTKNPNRIYVCNVELYRSDDAGQTFSSVRTQHSDNHDMWIDPNNPDRIVEANDGGANVSVNGGRTWTDELYSTAQIYHVTIASGFPYLVCGAQQDSGSKCLPNDGAGSSWVEGPAGESGYIAIDPRNTTLGYGGELRGQLVRYDRTSGERRRIDVWPIETAGQRSSEMKERFQWTFPIVLSPQNPNVLYTSSQHVWKTADAGHSWKAISPDLTRADPKTLVDSDEPVDAHNSQDNYATVFTLAPSPVDQKVIWAGSDDGLIHVTRSGGTPWQNVTPPDLPPFAKASLIFASFHAPGKAYLAAEHHKSQDLNTYLYKTSDYGRTWEKIVNGISPGDWACAVKEDPKRAGLLFAGTVHGVYVSFDDGAHWQSLSLNLPDVQVTDLDVHGNDLIISTFGRGIYILDDISPFRELTTEKLLKAAYLFEPGDTVRSAGTMEGGEYRSIPVPGIDRVEIAYYLQNSAQKIQIDILDAEGEVLRSYNAGPGTRPRKPVRNSLGDIINSPGWGSASAQPIPPLAPGLHRIWWDLKIRPAADFPGLLIRDTNVDGPIVPPGSYHVRLTVDGNVQERAVHVLKDPRQTGVTQAQLNEQFRFARHVEKLLNQATSSVLYIRQLRAEVDERMQSSPDLATSGNQLKARLRAAEEEIYEVRNASTADLMHWGTKITQKIATIYAIAKTEDGGPSEQLQAALAELGPSIDSVFSKFDKVVKTDVPAFNQLLRQKNLPALTTERPAEYPDQE